MAYRQHISDTARHARLFELIRQENLVNSQNHTMLRQKAPSMTQMQQFLKLANQSFAPTDESENGFNCDP